MNIFQVSAELTNGHQTETEGRAVTIRHGSTPVWRPVTVRVYWTTLKVDDQITMGKLCFENLRRHHLQTFMWHRVGNGHCTFLL